MSSDGKEGYASLRAARVIKNMPGGEAVLHVLLSHGFTSIVSYKDGVLQETCTIDRMLEQRA